MKVLIAKLKAVRATLKDISDLETIELDYATATEVKTVTLAVKSAIGGLIHDLTYMDWENNNLKESKEQ